MLLAAAKDRRLTPAAMRTLMVLAAGTVATQSALADMAGIDRPATSRAVRLLRACGYVGTGDALVLADVVPQTTSCPTDNTEVVCQTTNVVPQTTPGAPADGTFERGTPRDVVPQTTFAPAQAPAPLDGPPSSPPAPPLTSPPIIPPPRKLCAGVRTKKQATGKRGLDYTLADLPEPLRTQRFLDAWLVWAQWRTGEKKAPIGPVCAERQLANAAKYGVEPMIAAMANSMAQGYQGVFPEQHAQRPARRPVPPRAAVNYDESDRNGVAEALRRQTQGSKPCK